MQFMVITGHPLVSEYAVFTFIISQAPVLIRKLGHFLSWVCIVQTLGGAFGLSYNTNMNNVAALVPTGF